MFGFKKKKDERQVLSETLVEKEENLIKLRFDAFHSAKLWNEIEPDYNKLYDESVRIKGELDLLNVTGGKSSESKKKEVDLSLRLSEISTKIQEYGRLKDDVDHIKKVIPMATRVLDSLKECILSPNKIYDIQKTSKSSKIK